jgi:hypothetical protein
MFFVLNVGTYVQNYMVSFQTAETFTVINLGTLELT